MGPEPMYRFRAAPDGLAHVMSALTPTHAHTPLAVVETYERNSNNQYRLEEGPEARTESNSQRRLE